MYVETLRKYSGLVRRDPIFSYYLIFLERAPKPDFTVDVLQEQFKEVEF